MMKGIILAGGRGSRLYPLTLGQSKQTLPVYNKPMVYYPLSMLMLAHIREILLICNPEDRSVFQRILKDGSQWGLQIHYAIQDQPRGLADAFRIGADFVGSDPVCLVLGDNIFYGTGLPAILQKAANLKEGAIILAYPVKNPERYGVVSFNSEYQVTKIEEKPKNPHSRYAIPGIYFYDKQVVKMAYELKPSGRGELEITDINNIYLQRGQLKVEVLGRGFAWLDAGSFETLLQAANFIQTVEERQGMMISCPEEIAYRLRYIDSHQLRQQADALAQNGYGAYLLSLLEKHIVEQV